MKASHPLLMLLLLSGTARGAEPNAPAPPRLSFYHWWTSPSEAAALDGLIHLFKTRFAEAMVQPMVAGRGTSAILPVLEARAKDGDPPEVVFAHGGYSPEPFLRAGLLSP